MQLSFFETVESDGLLSIDSAAKKAGVSSATIRNWIKTGYLKKNFHGDIEKESFELFLKTVAGKEKLISRANKLLKSPVATNNNAVGNNLKADDIGNAYEQSLSESFRNKEGIFYTPSFIVSNLMDIDDINISSATFLDPCCGSGNFIIRALELGFKPENVFGYDTDPIAVEITKKRIFLKTGYISNNIQNANFLEKIALQKNNNGIIFDYIYTNPPWGKKIVKEEKERYGFIFQSGRSLDSCSLFFFACLRCLHKDGELGLLLPDSFFNIGAFEDARRKVLSLDVQRFVDYGKPFKGLMTKAFAFVLKNKECNEHSLVYSFANNPKSIINFQCSAESIDVIQHVYEKPHINLAHRADWGLGIVTGNNDKFLTRHPKNGFLQVFKGSDIGKKVVNNSNYFIPSDLTLYQQVAPIELYQASVKLIYKFISSDLCFFCDTEQRFILNSANMLIPHKNLPLSAIQLCDLLNSDFMNWLFKNLFKTHKVLRSDLESLPIHAAYFEKYPEFTEKTFLEFLSIERVNDGTYRVKK